MQQDKCCIGCGHSTSSAQGSNALGPSKIEMRKLAPRLLALQRCYSASNKGGDSGERDITILRTDASDFCVAIDSLELRFCYSELCSLPIVKDLPQQKGERHAHTQGGARKRAGTPKYIDYFFFRVFFSPKILKSAPNRSDKSAEFRILSPEFRVFPLFRSEQFRLKNGEFLRNRGCRWKRVTEWQKSSSD